MAEVHKFYPKDAANNPDMVLEQAIGHYEGVLILGWDKDGCMSARSSTNMADGGDVLWLLEKFKFNMLAGAYEFVESDEEE